MMIYSPWWDNDNNESGPEMFGFYTTKTKAKARLKQAKRDKGANRDGDAWGIDVIEVK